MYTSGSTWFSTSLQLSITLVTMFGEILAQKATPEGVRVRVRVIMSVKENIERCSIYKENRTMTEEIKYKIKVDMLNV